jgi:hypothetical protein
MMLVTATPPACHASVNAFYADPNNRETSGVHIHVYVVDDYAYVTWYGANTAGEGAFQHRYGRWCKIVNGGGMMGVKGMVDFGVPRATAVKLYAKMKRGG